MERQSSLRHTLPKEASELPVQLSPHIRSLSLPSTFSSSSFPIASRIYIVHRRLFKLSYTSNTPSSFLCKSLSQKDSRDLQYFTTVAHHFLQPALLVSQLSQGQQTHRPCFPRSPLNPFQATRLTS